MNNTVQLKYEIMAVLDLLPLEGLKLLAEFVAFLRAKFKIPQPIVTQLEQPEPFDWQQRMEAFIQDVSANHPFAKISREYLLARLRQTREEVYNEDYGYRHADLNSIPRYPQPIFKATQSE